MVTEIRDLCLSTLIIGDVGVLGYIGNSKRKTLCCKSPIFYFLSQIPLSTVVPRIPWYKLTTILNEQAQYIGNLVTKYVGSVRAVYCYLPTHNWDAPPARQTKNPIAKVQHQAQ